MYFSATSDCKEDTEPGTWLYEQIKTESGLINSISKTNGSFDSCG